VPVGLCVAGANRNDFKPLVETLMSSPVERPVPSSAHPQHLCLDKGYDFAEVRGLAAAFGFVAHTRARGEAAPAPEAEPGQQARRSRRRAHARLDEPLSRPAHALGQKSRELPGPSSLRLRPDCLPGRRLIRIATNTTVVPELKVWFIAGCDYLAV
jgi:hypothetical protein